MVAAASGCTSNPWCADSEASEQWGLEGKAQLVCHLTSYRIVVVNPLCLSLQLAAHISEVRDQRKHAPKMIPLPSCHV